MSIFPLIVRLGYPAPKHLQRVALAVAPESVLVSPCDLWSPWGSQFPRQITNGGNRGFEISLDVQHFRPEEIAVKTIDGFLIVEARHEERKEGQGWVKRQFTRRYALPEECNVDSLESQLSADGILTVIAPPVTLGTLCERIIPIIQTGPERKQPELNPESGTANTIETPADTMM